MRRAALLLVIGLAAACSPDRPAAPDATTDAAPDGAGSGSAAAFAMEASPKDTHLELMVAGLCLVIVAGPIRGSQRQRGDRAR